MKNRQIPYLRILIGIIFIIWGAIWLFFYDTGDDKMFLFIVSILFILIGTGSVIYSLYEILRYRKTGEVKAVTDERAELNSFKSLKMSYGLFSLSLLILIMLWLVFKLITAEVFASLVIFTYGISILANYAFYQIYERRG